MRERGSSATKKSRRQRGSSATKKPEILASRGCDYGSPKMKGFNTLLEIPTCTFILACTFILLEKNSHLYVYSHLYYYSALEYII